ncbi:MOXD2 protein, partial [Upupa epops]|nr:MOXD2 protein [Upupa epops]
VDTTCIVTAFATDGTVQVCKSQRHFKSLFLMRYRGPTDSIDPKIFFNYDLRLGNFVVPVKESKYACSFIPLPMGKQEHHICKVNLEADLLGKNMTGQ